MNSRTQQNKYEVIINVILSILMSQTICIAKYIMESMFENIQRH